MPKAPARSIADLLPIAVEAVDIAGRIVRSSLPGAVTVKGDRDPATEVDYEVERVVRDYLSERAPHVGFLGEESGSHGDQTAEFMWALDPLDGTVNFMHGLPLCAISLGLLASESPVLGVISLPFLNTCYSAVQGAGAFRGRQKIEVSRTHRLRDAVIAMGDFAVGEQAQAKNAFRFAITQRLAEKVQRVRMIGSAAIDLAWVADGRLDASVMLANKPWDTAAGVLLAREAGALVLDREGRPHSIHSTSTIATSPGLAHHLLELLSVQDPGPESS